MSAIQRKVDKTTGSNPKKRKKLALGKGLDALIPGIESGQDKPADYFFCETDLISPNRYQPRLQFAEDELKELEIWVAQNAYEAFRPPEEAENARGKWLKINSLMKNGETLREVFPRLPRDLKEFLKGEARRAKGTKLH